MKADQFEKAQTLKARITQLEMLRDIILSMFQSVNPIDIVLHIGIGSANRMIPLEPPLERHNMFFKEGDFQFIIDAINSRIADINKEFSEL